MYDTPTLSRIVPMVRTCISYSNAAQMDGLNFYGASHWLYRRRNLWFFWGSRSSLEPRILLIFGDILFYGTIVDTPMIELNNFRLRLDIMPTAYL